MAGTATKFANNRGCQIAYKIYGSGSGGPFVVLQHGFLASKEVYEDYSRMISQAGFQVIAVDSLGHGESTFEEDATKYNRKDRAGDIAAVLDAENIEKVNYIGYSMGGWIGQAFAQYYPERLISLTIGGWAPVDEREQDLQNTRNETEFKKMLESVKSIPQYKYLAESIKENQYLALSGAFQALGETQGQLQGLITLSENYSDVPILLWSGRQDNCYKADKTIATIYNFDFLEVDGDHGSARKDNLMAVRGLIKYLKMYNKKLNENTEENSKDELILHGYAGSPYAERIRCLLRLKGLKWRELTVPSIDENRITTLLTGGYRRIPVLQIGADFYCDTYLIMKEIEKRFPTPEKVRRSTALDWTFVDWSDMTIFQGLVGQMDFSSFGSALDDDGANKFVEDRSKLSGRDLSQADPKIMNMISKLNFPQLRSAFELVESDLKKYGGTVFIGGSELPSVCDAAIYSHYWFLQVLSKTSPDRTRIGRLVRDMPMLQQWAIKMNASIAQTEEIFEDEVIDIARNCKPVERYYRTTMNNNNNNTMNNKSSSDDAVTSENLKQREVFEKEWQVMKDRRSEKTYYYNAKLNISSWVKPNFASYKNSDGTDRSLVYDNSMNENVKKIAGVEVYEKINHFDKSEFDFIDFGKDVSISGYAAGMSVHGKLIELTSQSISIRKYQDLTGVTSVHFPRRAPYVLNVGDENLSLGTTSSDTNSKL